VTQGGQETDVGSAVRSTTRGTLFMARRESKRRTFYLLFRDAITFLLSSSAELYRRRVWRLYRRQDYVVWPSCNKDNLLNLSSSFV